MMGAGGIADNDKGRSEKIYLKYWIVGGCEICRNCYKRIYLKINLMNREVSFQICITKYFVILLPNTFL